MLESKWRIQFSGYFWKIPVYIRKFWLQWRDGFMKPCFVPKQTLWFCGNTSPGGNLFDRCIRVSIFLDADARKQRLKSAGFWLNNRSQHPCFDSAGLKSQKADERTYLMLECNLKPKCEIGMPLQAELQLSVFGNGWFYLEKESWIFIRYRHPLQIPDKIRWLPPGPINLPDIKFLDRGMKCKTHDYPIFCAKERNFPGIISFAKLIWRSTMQTLDGKSRLLLNAAKISIITVYCWTQSV